MEIEEIAEQYSLKDLGKTSPAYELGFTQGANYQHKIDIDKAQCLCCEALCYDRDSCEIEDVECERLLMIRKAMEE